jgi:sulfite exporter TauE/SafE
MDGWYVATICSGLNTAFALYKTTTTSILSSRLRLHLLYNIFKTLLLNLHGNQTCYV